MPKRLNPHSSISSREAASAFYIDFEGFQDKAPTLLGLLTNDDFKQVVFDRVLETAADAKNLEIVDLKLQIKELVDRCRKESRFLVAYSQHELHTINEFAEIDISDVYRDARMIAKKWKAKCHPGTTKCKGLKDYLKFIEFPRGAHLGERKVTSRIRAVRNMLLSRGHYSKLTRGVKTKWTNLLSHNEIDCKGMQALVLKAANEVEECAPQ